MSIDRVNLLLARVGDRLNSGYLLKRASLILTNELVSETPVRDGIAKSNWFVTRNTPSQDVNPMDTDQKPKGIQNINAAKGDDTIWVCNNLPYIVRLDNGWSGQAPAGFSHIAIKFTRDKVKVLIRRMTRGS